MLSTNPPTNLHTRQQQRRQQHRRQNSTPNAFDAVKVSNLPNIQRHGGHRRGMSLDTRRRQSPPQEFRKITNQGFQPQQHILRETQQQSLLRSGQHFVPFDNDDNYHSSPNVTPHRQSFDAGCMNQYGGHGGGQLQYYPGPIKTMISVDTHSFNGSNDFDFLQNEAAMTPSAFLDFSAGFDNQSSSGHTSRRSSAGRRISGGILDRVAQFESLALQSPHRPTTPTQNAPFYYSDTLMDTPHEHMIKQEQMNPRFLDSYDTSMEETIKPKSQRARGIFDDMRKQAEMSYLPTPPSSDHQIQQPTTFDSAPMPSNRLNLSNANIDFLKNEGTEDLQYSPVSHISSHMSNLSYASSPDIPQSAGFETFATQSRLDAAPMSYPEVSSHGLPVPDSPTRKSELRRSESVCSINVEETITDTGITIDDIATYIQGPDPLDGKWLCLFPECKKRFGRKENIKSHVQTHLGDRQYQCPHCRKCFVRQHDLKRHAKIHSGVKPYPCQCGNSFARHDALTRHRQRGMCIGAFEGVVKKTVKRGRPRKNRPDDEDRLAKSSRTRSKNKTTSSASSTTSCSESGETQSPCSEADLLHDQPFDDYGYTQSSIGPDQGSFQFSQPQSPRPTQGVSPQEIQAHSPSAYSHHSHVSRHNSISESVHLPSYPASPAKSVHSYHSPPGLCESSSSPAVSHYYDIDHSSQHGDSVHFNMNGLANISEHDDEMFLHAFENSGNCDMTTLEREPNLLMGKFEDPIVNTTTDDMFRTSLSNSEDIFFGSP